MRKADGVLAGLVLCVLLLLVVPLPTFLLDGLLTLNLAIAVLLLMATLWVREPRQMSVFPALIVLTTLLRVALNVATTRLILRQANAGRMVEAFGQAAAGGSLVVGLVVFLVIAIVQLLVVAKGAERIAEVAARFALDAMPGQQQALDADVRLGLLDAEGGRQARHALDAEAQLFGAMDGAMRFVKGDTIASLVIVGISLIGGILMGTLVQGLPVAEAVGVYAVLSMGEGLLAQIPSFLTAIAAALLVARVAGHRASASLGVSLIAQLGARPAALASTAALLAVFALLPLMPMLPLLVLAAACAVAAYAVARQQRAVEVARQGGRLVLYLPRGVAASPAACLRWQASLDAAVGQAVGATPGLAVRRHDAAGWRLELDGLGLAEEDTVESWEQEVVRALTGAQATWVQVDHVAARLAELRTHHPLLVREAVPTLLTLGQLTELLRVLAQSGVPRVLPQLPAILAAVQICGKPDDDRQGYAERLRAELVRQLSAHYAPTGLVRAYTLDAMIEDAVRDAASHRRGPAPLPLEPDILGDIIQAFARVAAHDPHAVVLASGDVRRHVHSIVCTHYPRLAILAPHELAPGVVVENAGRITVGVA